MKIWYQSAGSLGKREEYTEYESTLKTYLNSIARPGTQVDVHGVNICSRKIQSSRYEELLHQHQIVENLLQAQQEGYDAFAVGCALDPAFYALREVADIPIASLSEATMLLACLLAPNFSLLCQDKPLLRRVMEYVKRYGLSDRYIQCDSFEVSRKDLFRAFDDPEILLKPARRVAREAAEKGVTMFVVAENIVNMIFAKHKINQIENIPILEGGGALVKIAEMLVDLRQMGINRSQLGLYSPLAKEDLKSMRELYGVA